MQRVVIVGAGFGGAKAATELAKDSSFEVTVVNDTHHLRYYPVLYHFVIGGLKAESFIPLSKIFNKKRINLIVGQAMKLDKVSKKLTLESGQVVEYDVLVLALGSVTNYFNIGGLQEHAFAIKSLHEGQRLRDHLHQELMDDGKPELHYIVVGAGPTGVELSAGLAQYLAEVIPHHHIPTSEWHIDLVEAAPRVLPRSAEDVSAKVQARLEKLGVQLHLGATVEGATGEELKLKDSSMASKTIIWTAGVAPSPFYGANADQFSFNDKKRLVLDEHLSAGNDVYVIGDNAPTQFSGLAQTAVGDALYVSKNLKRAAAGQALLAYEPEEPVYATPVGEGWAAIQWGKKRYYGRIGWWIRRMADLVGYRDLLPTHQALGLMWAGEHTEETCPVCRGELTSEPAKA